MSEPEQNPEVDLNDPRAYPKNRWGLTDLSKLPVVHKPPINTRFRHEGEQIPENLTERICDWIAEGNTLADFCRMPDSPSKRTVNRWRLAYPEFHARLEAAEAIRFEEMAEQALQAASTVGKTETVIVEPGDGKRKERRKIITEDNVARSKLKVETILKLLACWNPRRYGPKAQIEHSGNIDLADKMRAAQERLDARPDKVLLTSQALTQALHASEDVARELLQLPPSEPSDTPAE